MSELPQVLSLPSGARLELQHAPFSVSMKLLKTIARELAAVSLGLKIDLNLADPQAMISKLLREDLPLDLIKNAVCQLVASDAVEAVVAECLGRCLYNNVGIDKKTFEPAGARGDYLPAAWEVIQFNLRPFFSGLSLPSSTAKPLGSVSPG